MMGPRLALAVLALTLTGAGCALIDAMMAEDKDPGTTQTGQGAGGHGPGGTGHGGDVPQGGGCIGESLEYRSPQVWAAHPSIVFAGDPARLEGEFAPGGTTAKLQGAQVQEVAGQLLADSGVARAEVSTATADPFTGRISVYVDDTERGDVPFRATPFELGLTRLQNHYEQTGYARSMPVLAEPLRGHTVEAIGPYLYAIGGSSSTQVQRAFINADSSLTRFTSAEISLYVPRSEHVSVRLDTGPLSTDQADHVYVIGGAVGGTPVASVEKADVDNDGELRSFAVPDPPIRLVEARAGAALAIIGRFVYVFGGRSEATGAPLATIERAEISAKATLGPFETIPCTALNSGRFGHTVEVIGDYVYVIGGTGTDPDNLLKSVERARIDGNANLGVFEEIDELKEARSGHESIVLCPWLYVVGGNGNGNLHSSVEAYRIDEEDSVPPPAIVEAQLPEARAEAAGVVVGNDFYLLGGTTNSSPQGTGTIVRGPIVANAQPQPFSSGRASLNRAGQYGHAVVAGVDNVYSLGGTDEPGSGGGPTHQPIFGTAVGERGELWDPFSDTGQWTHPRRGACVAVLGDYLYVIGGHDGSGVTETVQRVELEDGPEAPVIVTEASELEPHQDAACAVLGDRLYVIGGSNPSALDYVQYATFNATGDTLSDFSPTDSPDPKLNHARSGHSVAVLFNRLYVIGGRANGTGPIASDTAIEVAIIDPSDWSLDDFNTASLLPTPKSHAAATVVGPQFYLIGGWTDSQVTATTRGAIIPWNGALPDIADGGPALTTPRRATSPILLGDYLYVTGGQGGGTATSDSHDTVIE